jgi:hypothetical protein
MSHDMLHHAELKIFFEVLHKFEFGFENSIGKRKGIRNSREIGKANSAQGSPISPARARPRALSA